MDDLLDRLFLIALGVADELTDEADRKTLARDREEFERKRRTTRLP